MPRSVASVRVDGTAWPGGIRPVRIASRKVCSIWRRKGWRDCRSKRTRSSGRRLVLSIMGILAITEGPVQDYARALAVQIAGDRHTRWMPISVVATAGTTSTGSVDPVAAIADLCAAEGLWCGTSEPPAGIPARAPGARRPLMTRATPARQVS
ncbi:MAG: hypothetical protein KJ061_19645 [Vicinamibacteraceae bacterium]|nr:hypothetical protein [Vicinamibacteraceae bacterium]